jgi:hypothetical protein
LSNNFVLKLILFTKHTKMKISTQKTSVFTVLSLGITLFCNAQNIGINTPNAKSTLSVKGGLGIGKNYSATNESPTDGAIIEGNVGIGTFEPTEKLHVVGSTIIDGGKLIFRNTGKSIFIGEYAGVNDNLADRINVYIGESAGSSNTEGFSNVYIGSNAGGQNETGNSNVAIGEAALYSSLTSFNVAIGKYALNENTNGENNTAIGNYAGFGSSGKNNFFLGTATGESSTGSFNVFLGNEVGSYSTGSNKLYIDNSNTNKPLIEGDFLDKTLKINGKFSATENAGIKTDTPYSALEINGAFGLKVKSGLEAGIDDLDESAGIWIYTSGTGIISLPTASSCPNRTYTICNKTSASLPISSYFDMSNTSQNTLASGTSIFIVSDGSNWQQIK